MSEYLEKNFRPTADGRQVGRGAFFLYAGSIINMALGYIYLLIISRLIGPEAVGVTSTMVNTATLLATVAMLGVPLGLQRFLGKAAAEKELGLFRGYSRAAILLVSCTGGAVSIILGLGVLKDLVNLPHEFFILAAVVAFSSCLTSVFNSTFISLLRTKILALADTISSFLKIMVGVGLVVLGFGVFGIAVGYMFGYVVFLCMVVLFSLKLVWSSSTAITAPASKLVRDVVKAGSANWIPAIVIALGSQLGVIVVFGFSGAFDAGLYYIAFALMMAVSSIPIALRQVMFPVLSGMSDGRKRAAWRTIRLSLVFTIPIISVLIIYGRILLGIFGNDFVGAQNILVILLCGSIFSRLSDGMIILAYAYGMYRYVFLSGLIENVPRVLLYIGLVPVFGGEGAGVAFLVGSISCFTVTSLVFSPRIGIKIRWGEVAKIISIPLILGLLMFVIGLPWVLGVSIILVASGILYVKFNLITRLDIGEVKSAVLPRKIANVSLEKLGQISGILGNGSPMVGNASANMKGRTNEWKAKPDNPASAGRNGRGFSRLQGKNSWFFAVIICTVGVLITIYLLPETPLNIILRWILGTIFVLFIPGFALMQVLFPDRKEVDDLVRIVLSVVLSIAIITLVGLLLNYTPWGISLNSIVVSLSAFAIISIFIGRYRQHLLTANKNSALG